MLVATLQRLDGSAFGVLQVYALSGLDATDHVHRLPHGAQPVQLLGRQSKGKHVVIATGKRQLACRFVARTGSQGC